jgi:hypothetical protein
MCVSWIREIYCFCCRSAITELTMHHDPDSSHNIVSGPEQHIYNPSFYALSNDLYLRFKSTQNIVNIRQLNIFGPKNLPSKTTYLTNPFHRTKTSGIWNSEKGCWYRGKLCWPTWINNHNVKYAMLLKSINLKKGWLNWRWWRIKT